MKLTPKQRMFVAEYIVDLNATQAAIRAGYSAKTAGRAAAKLVVKSCVSEAIQVAIIKREKRTEVTQDRVIAELAKIGFANMQDYMIIGQDGYPRLDYSNLTRDQAAALSEVQVEAYNEGQGISTQEVKKVRFKLIDKKGALELLGKHLGLFPNKVEQSGPHGGPIQHEVVSKKQFIQWVKEAEEKY